MSTRTLSLRMVSIYALKLILIVLLSMSWLLVDFHRAHACSCRAIDPAEAYNRSAAVFSGEAIDLALLYNRIGNPPRLFALHRLAYSTYEPGTVTLIYTFKVDTIWKGPSYEHVYLQTTTSEACGAAFPPGIRFLVYSTEGTSAYLCGTLPLRFGQEHLDALGEGRSPERGTRAPELEIMRSSLSEDEMIQKLEALIAEVRAELDAGLPAPTGESATRQPAVSTTPGPRIPERTIRGLARALYQLLEERMARLSTPTPIPTPTAVPTPTPIPATPAPQPTSTPLPTPATLAAATTLPPTSIPSPEPAANVEEARAPGWLIPAIAGAGAVLVAVLGATLTLRRRRDGI